MKSVELLNLGSVWGVRVGGDEAEVVAALKSVLGDSSGAGPVFHIREFPTKDAAVAFAQAFLGDSSWNPPSDSPPDDAEFDDFVDPGGPVLTRAKP